MKKYIIPMLLSASCSSFALCTHNQSDHDIKLNIISSKANTQTLVKAHSTMCDDKSLSANLVACYKDIQKSARTNASVHDIGVPCDITIVTEDDYGKTTVHYHSDPSNCQGVDFHDSY